MIRRLLAILFGPRCDQGALGTLGCLCRARWVNPVHRPPAWDRALVWCDLHRMHWDVPLEEGTFRKGGQNLSYQITKRPPDPPPMRPGYDYQPLPGPGGLVKPPPRKP